ncbi:hypothetical protein GCM10009535_45890 [Streptomyces thermocarboxydovorans]|uniref:Bacterial DNA polymerase III alpha subunit NTPase domain-containing protein n=1 Tax=Streptomyces thermocarboxydovorans TaxID=59298 RepID=A0ABP3SS38_9ACTN
MLCYALGITSVDALKHGLLFERFLHAGKTDPDIDIDFENDRREEVIQYLYAKYGRSHCAQVANLITYQSRLSVRDSARALGYSMARINEMTRHIHHEPAFSRPILCQLQVCCVPAPWSAVLPRRKRAS